MGPCHMVAGGGIASRAVSWHDRIVRGPTHITPIGLLADADGKRINLRDFAIDTGTQMSESLPTIVAIIGTAMDAGKTQTAAFLVRGLIAAGLRVGYAKITGTGAGGDTWLLKDAGADPVLDFTDAGLASTYLAAPEEIEAILVTLRRTSRSKVSMPSCSRWPTVSSSAKQQRCCVHPVRPGCRRHGDRRAGRHGRQRRG